MPTLCGMTATLYAPTLLYDGTTNPPRSGCGVVVEGGVVRAVGPVGDIQARATVVEHLEGTLLPGLMDCHTHVVLAATADPAATFRTESRTRTTARALGHLAAHLCAGVTTIRDLGGGPDGVDLELMRAVERGEIPGPRMMAAGALVAMTGGHACYLGLEADGPEDVRRAVRRQLKAGAAVIKVVATGGIISAGVDPGSPQMTLAELQAAVEEARKAGRRVAAHAQGTQGILNALHAGVQSIEHGFWLDDACVALMASHGTFYVATFAAAQGMLDHLDALPPFIRRKMEALGDSHAQSFSRALAANLNLAAGTDAGTPFNPHGTLWREVSLLQRHGASPVAALFAATGGAAALLGRDDLGVLKPGALADLVLVRGDPTQQPDALKDVLAVWQGGRAVDLITMRALAHHLSPAH